MGERRALRHQPGARPQPGDADPAAERGVRQPPAAEWVAGALALGIPAGTLNTVSQILDDPHVQARGLIRDLDGLRLVGPPVGFSETLPTVRTPPPALGEHTDAILRERLGMTTDEIAAHRRDGVI